MSTQFCRLSSLSSIYRNEGLVCCLGSNFAYALALCCLASSAEAAGIQLLGSDPGLSGAIWYPCAGEPKHVALGSLAVAEDFGLMGGLHLSGVNEEIIPQTVAELEAFNVPRIAAGHCTGWRALVALANTFGESVVTPTAVGKVYSIKS